MLLASAVKLPRDVHVLFFCIFLFALALWLTALTSYRCNATGSVQHTVQTSSQCQDHLQAHGVCVLSPFDRYSYDDLHLCNISMTLLWPFQS